MLVNLGGKLLETRACVMAIVNVTPDSFFEGSRTRTEKEISGRVERVLAEGAHWIDLGGYSSRVGAEDISPDEEYTRLERGFRVVRAVAGSEYPVSVDTFRGEVVRRLYDEFGPFIVNDISAGDLDSKMIPLVAGLELPYIAMHMRGTPQTMKGLTDYPRENDGVVGEVLRYFVRKVAEIRQAGVKDLILDPGFGFAKTPEQNFELLGRMREMRIFELPVLAGLSRKSMIWRTLDVTPKEALNGTSVLNWEALRKGADILRVHDVREAVEVQKLHAAFEKERPEDVCL